MKYEYKSIHSMFTRTGGKNIDERIDEIMNKQADQGWEYYNTASVDELVPAGCLHAFLGGKGELLFHHFLIFRKQKND